MRIAVLGAGHIGSTVGRLWHAAGHEITFAAQDDAEPGHWQPNSVTAPFEKLRDHAPSDPAFFFEHLCRAVFQAGMSWRVVSAKWDGIREAFHGFDPGKVASLQPADIARIEADARVIRNSAKIEATIQNAQELLVILREHGSIRAYLASFPDARSAAADLHRRFRFLGDAGVWRLLTNAAGDLG